MTFEFHYGDGLSVELELENASIHGAGGTGGLCGESVAERVAGALQDPLGLPPFHWGLTSQDTLAVAVAPGVPGCGAILRAIVRYLLDIPAEHRPERVVFLFPTAQEMPQIPTLDELRPDDAPAELALDGWLSVARHDPDISDAHALLGVSEAGESLVVARTLFDADCVLPVSVAGEGLEDGLYPLFADTRTRRRLQAAPDPQEAVEMVQQLGVIYFCRVIPHLGGSVGDILLGDRHEVGREAQRRYRDHWAVREQTRPMTVLGSILGGAGEQTWPNAVRGLGNMSRVSDLGATLALCTEMAGELPPSLERFREIQDWDIAAKVIRREARPDAALVLELLEILANYRVCLLSGLDTETVEDLGIVALENVADLRRFMARAGVCTVLEDAHRAAV